MHRAIADNGDVSCSQRIMKKITTAATFSAIETRTSERVVKAAGMTSRKATSKITSDTVIRLVLESIAPQARHGRLEPCVEMTACSNIGNVEPQFGHLVRLLSMSALPQFCCFHCDALDAGQEAHVDRAT